MENLLPKIETIKLKTLIFFSRRIPSEYKVFLSKQLISKREPKKIKYTKFIFSHYTFLDAYDIFTSSILAYHYRNRISLEILIRAQLENFLLTGYLSHHPKEIKDILQEDVWKSKKKSSWKSFFKSNEDYKRWSEYYHKFISRRAHPLPMRFLSGISFFTFMKPKNGANMAIFLDKSYNKLPPHLKKKIVENTLEPAGVSPAVTMHPHNTPNEGFWEYKIMEIMYLFDSTVKNLKVIEEKCPNYEMSDSDWKTAIKNHKR